MSIQLVTYATHLSTLLSFRELKLVKSMISETAFIFEFHDLLIPTRRNSKKIESPVQVPGFCLQLLRYGHSVLLNFTHNQISNYIKIFSKVSEKLDEEKINGGRN